MLPKKTSPPPPYSLIHQLSRLASSQQAMTDLTLSDWISVTIFTPSIWPCQNQMHRLTYAILSNVGWIIEHGSTPPGLYGSQWKERHLFIIVLCDRWSPVGYKMPWTSKHTLTCMHAHILSVLNFRSCGLELPVYSLHGRATEEQERSLNLVFMIFHLLFLLLTDKGCA